MLAHYAIRALMYEAARQRGDDADGLSYVHEAASVGRRSRASSFPSELPFPLRSAARLGTGGQTPVGRRCLSAFPAGEHMASGSSRHHLRIRTWVTASNHRRITAPHTRTFSHGAALATVLRFRHDRNVLAASNTA